MAKKSKKEKHYVVAYLTETDGEAAVVSLTAEQIKEQLVKPASERMFGSVRDIAIIEGTIIKCFDSPQLPREIEKG